MSRCLRRKLNYAFAVRVIFIGNIGGYSQRFLAPLAARSADPADPVSVVAVICPVALDTRSAALSFAIKRRLGKALQRVLKRLTPKLVGAFFDDKTDGLWYQMQKLAHDAGAIVLWPQKLAEPGVVDQVAVLESDLVIVAGLDRILRARVLAAFPPVLNIHPSLLPEYRGASPEFWQLDAGCTEGGVTIHVIEAGIDTGPIVLQRRFPIESWLDADGLVERCIKVGIELTDQLLDGWPEIAANPTPQVGGSHQPAPGPEDRLVPFEHSWEAVFNRARAVGFRSPLSVHVPRGGWDGGDATMQCLRGPNGESIALELYDPVPYPNAVNGRPGQLTRTMGGGATITCKSGVVEFRRVVAMADGEIHRPSG